MSIGQLQTIEHSTHPRKFYWKCKVGRERDSEDLRGKSLLSVYGHPFRHQDCSRCLRYERARQSLPLESSILRGKRAPSGINL